MQSRPPPGQSEASVSPWQWGDEVLLSSAAVDCACGSPGVSAGPEAPEILPLASRDHPPPPGCTVLRCLGQVSSLDPGCLSNSHITPKPASLPGNVRGKPHSRGTTMSAWRGGQQELKSGTTRPLPRRNSGQTLKPPLRWLRNAWQDASRPRLVKKAGGTGSPHGFHQKTGWKKITLPVAWPGFSVFIFPDLRIF